MEGVIKYPESPPPGFTCSSMKRGRFWFPGVLIAPLPKLHFQVRKRVGKGTFGAGRGGGTKGVGVSSTAKPSGRNMRLPEIKGPPV